MGKKFLIIFFIIVYLTISFLAYSNNKNFQTDKGKNILIIQSYNQGYDWTDNIQKGLVDNLAILKNIEIYTEYLDANRKALTDSYLLEFERYIYAKYNSMKIDLLIVVDDEALNFVLKRRKSLFDRVPIVFCGINDFNPSLLSGFKDITGVNEEKPIKENIELILSINEKTGKKLKKIAIIAGSRISDKKTLESFMKKAKMIPSNITIDVFNGIELDKILEKIGNYSEYDVIICISYILSPDDTKYSDDEVLKKISEKTNAKIFVLNDILIKNNVLGGYVVTSYDHGEDAAKIAIKILNGQNANSIKIKMDSFKRYLFNYDSLIKYKLPLGILPQNTILVNYSEGENFKRYYKSLNQNNLLSYELFQNYGLIMLLIDPENGNIIDANKRARVFYGYDNITEMKIQNINTLTEEEVKAEMKKAKEENKNYFNFRHRLANGQIRDVEVYSYPVLLYGKKLLFSIIIDVTERLLTEKLKKEEERKLLLTLIVILVLSFFFIIFIVIYFLERKKYIKELEEKNEKLEKANHEIKTLQGIIPICSICKKIRTDEGYWQSVENYITNHSEALFSHSICPDCAKKYYGINEKDLKKLE